MISLVSTFQESSYSFKKFVINEITKNVCLKLRVYEQKIKTINNANCFHENIIQLSAICHNMSKNMCKEYIYSES